MKWIFILLLITTALFTIPFPAVAAAKSSSVAISGKYVKERNVVQSYFSNFKGVSKVSYMLFYVGNGVGQGVMGSFSPGKSKSVSKQTYLGTCSGKVCTPHRSVKNIQLEVTTYYTNGKSSTKTIKVK